jgi:HEAT repeat protein
VHFEFGRPLEPLLTDEEILSRMVAEYASRRDELWDVILDRAHQILLSMLPAAESDPVRLAIIIHALGRNGLPLHQDRVRPYLKASDLAVRRAAVRTLGQMQSIQDLGAITLLLRDPDATIRRNAVISLGQLAQASVLPAIQEAVAADRTLAQPAREAERRMQASQGGSMLSFVESFIETDQFEDLATIAAVCSRELLSILGDPRREDLHRARAARILYLRRARQAGPIYKPILRDPATPRLLRLEVIRGCGVCVIRSAYELVLPYLSSNDEEMRLTAIEALGRMDEPRALEPLMEQWADEPLRPAVRLAIRRLARRPGPPALIDYMTENTDTPVVQPVVIRDDLRMIRQLPMGVIAADLNNPAADARLDAVSIIGLFGTADFLPGLRQLAERDPVPLVREAARLAAARFSPRVQG